MSHGELYCPACLKSTPHIKVNGSSLKCMICGRERAGSMAGSAGKPSPEGTGRRRHA